MTDPIMIPRLEGLQAALRPGGPADVPALLAMFAEPAVEQWWFPQDEPKVRERISRDSQYGWIIEQDTAVVGWIQAGEEDDEEYRSAWIDIAVTAELHGRGVALDALGTAMRFLIDGLGHHRITIDPDVENQRAVGAYGKVRFRAVGVMRHYGQRPDGSFSDNLLMEHVVGIDD